jgi:hypothetical protein
LTRDRWTTYRCCYCSPSRSRRPLSRQGPCLLSPCTRCCREFDCLPSASPGAILACTAAWSGGHAENSQHENQNQKPGRNKEVQLRVIEMRHASAEELAQSMQSLGESPAAFILFEEKRMRLLLSSRPRTATAGERSAGLPSPSPAAREGWSWRRRWNVADAQVVGEKFFFFIVYCCFTNDFESQVFRLAREPPVPQGTFTSWFNLGRMELAAGW